MAAKKPKAPKSPKTKPESMLGTGIARQGAKSIQKMAQRRCLAMGGKYVNGKCIY